MAYGLQPNKKTALKLKPLAQAQLLTCVLMYVCRHMCRYVCRHALVQHYGASVSHHDAVAAAAAAAAAIASSQRTRQHGSAVPFSSTAAWFVDNGVGIDMDG